MKKYKYENSEWLERWNENKIGFHQSGINPYLEKYFDKFTSKNNNIFVPLCGKSIDILWLSDRVNKVIGVELIQKAIDDFVRENSLLANKSKVDGFLKYEISNIDLFVGDFFDFNVLQNTKVDIFDRASLIALDDDMRKEYAKKIIQILNGKMLLVTLEYANSNKKGPPFSVSEEEVYRLYGDKCSIELLESVDLTKSEDKFSGLEFAFEKVFLVSNKLNESKNK